MASKSSLNDYSALGSLFRDGALGVLISTGVLSTLVPNAIESVGKVKDLNSFLTLNLFSVIYFLFPIIIFTSYWLLRGSTLFITEKFSVFEISHYRAFKGSIENPTSTKDRVSSLLWLKWLLAFLKLLPLALFIYDEEFFSEKWIYTVGLYYVLLAIVQVWLCSTIDSRWLSGHIMHMKDDRTNEFLYRSYCINALIYFLDVIIGLTLIIFSKPWIVYSEAFYFIASLAIVVYAVASWAFSVYRFKEARLNIEDFLVAVLLASAGLALPIVNLSNHGIACALTAALFAVVTLWWLSIEKGLNQNKRWHGLIKVMGPALLIFVSATLVHIWLYQGIIKSNFDYFQNRNLASQQISDKEVFPFSDYTRSIEIARENHYLESYLNIESLASTLRFVPFLQNGNLRMTFYREYFCLKETLSSKKATLDKIVSTNFKHQCKIDSFYSNVFKDVESLELGDLKKKVKENGDNTLSAYLHPLDYTASKLTRLAEYKSQADSMVRLAESIYSLALLKKNKQTAVSKVTEITDQKAAGLISRLDRLYKQSIDLRFDKSNIDPKLDSAQLVKAIRFHKLFFEYRENQYINAYVGAQKVYRSYLVDSQRIGVWTFLTTVLVLAMATYFNRKAIARLSPPSKSHRQEKEDLPLDSPKNALFIQTLAVFILLVPLLKPIEPQNIDPEKSYWMISLQNWYTPNFIKGLTEKDEARPNYFGYGNTNIDNFIDFRVLESQLKDLSGQSIKIQKEINKVDSSIRLLKGAVENSDEQLKP